MGTLKTTERLSHQLFETCGLYKKSRIRKVDLDTVRATGAFSVITRTSS